MLVPGRTISLDNVCFDLSSSQNNLLCIGVLAKLVFHDDAESLLLFIHVNLLGTALLNRGKFLHHKYFCLSQYTTVYTQINTHITHNIHTRTSCPVGICLASFTFAKFPLPIVFSNLYFPTYTSSPGGLEEGIFLP